MVKIITVHGTNAGAESDAGDQWWQLRSDFQKKLSARLGETVEFEPFHWSGANSEIERRHAGGRLARKLTEEREPPVVIGHSHGGSVALHALSLLYLNNKKSPERAAGYFRSLLTVGTPMIRHRAAWNPIFRFNIVGQLFAIYAALITLLVAGAILGGGVGVVQDLTDLVGRSILTPFIDLEGGPLAFAAQLFTPAMLFAGILPIVILFYFAQRSSQRHGLFRSNRLISVVEKIYRPLNHAGDEAIAALRAGVGLRLKLIDRKTVRAAIFAPVALGLAGILAVRTISERVILDFDRPLIELAGAAFSDAPPEVMVVEEGEPLDDWTMIEEAVPEAEAIGELTLSIRDAGSRIRRLSGNLRRNSGAEDRRRSGLTRQTVYLLDDYLVLDVPTAMRFTNKADLLSYLEVLAPNAPAGITLGPQGECAHYAVYLTQAGHDRVMEWARALPTGGAGGVSWAPPEPVSARARTAEDKVEPCTRSDALPLPTEGTPLGTLLTEDRLVELAGEALVSQGPLAVAQADTGPQSYGEVWLPVLRRGEAMIFERSAFNDAKFACLFAGIRAPFIGLNPLRADGPARLRSLRGFCDQIEGAEITGYDTATTVLAEINYQLRKTVELGGALIDRGVKAVGLRRADGEERSAADIISDETVETGILAPVYFVLSVIICAYLVAWLLSLVLAPVLSGIFNSVIKQNVFGNDGHGEEVVQVAPGLDFTGKTVGTLPAGVQQDLTDYVQQYAPQTIARVRDIITFSTSEADGHLPVQQLSESLTWKELIHTAYFDVDSFVDHVATVLEETGAVTPR